jgi:two-component system LytT family response regulator
LIIQKVILKILDKAVATQKDLILHNTIAVSNNSLQKLAIPSSDGLIFIHLDDIVRFESYGTYTYIYTVKKEKIIASRNIKEFENILPKNQFFRIHNSHLININRLIKYNKGRGGTITMEDGTRIEVASRRKIEFLNLFQH